MKPHKLLQPGATPGPATNFQEIAWSDIQIPGPFAGTFVRGGWRRRRVWPKLDTNYQCVMFRPQGNWFLTEAQLNEIQRDARRHKDRQDGPFDRAWAKRMIEEFRNPELGRS